jgi:transposase-like protein
MENNKQHNLSKSVTVEAIPLACSDELAGVELLEALRWGENPTCVHCGSAAVYKMKDAATGERSKRYLWRCHDCKKQYTVRIGTVYEESRIELRHWCYAFWRASTSKKGVAALEIKRHCQISYKSALFLMNRIRFAMAPDQLAAPKLTGIVECDETRVGGKPRHCNYYVPRPPKKKTVVFAAVQRDGQIRRRVIADVSAKTLKAAIREVVDSRARIYTDDFPSYDGIGNYFSGGHRTVNHSKKEYVCGTVHTNTAESSFALIKRGIMGIYHSVSREHLHRYISQFDFLWNLRKLNDGERTIAAIKCADGKRLMYKEPIVPKSIA